MFNLFKSVAQCINRKQSQRGGSRRTAAARFRPGMEILEGRDMPAAGPGISSIAYPPTSNTGISSIAYPPASNTVQARLIQPVTPGVAVSLQQVAKDLAFQKMSSALAALVAVPAPVQVPRDSIVCARYADPGYQTAPSVVWGLGECASSWNACTNSAILSQPVHDPAAPTNPSNPLNPNRVSIPMMSNIALSKSQSGGYQIRLDFLESHGHFAVIVGLTANASVTLLAGGGASVSFDMQFNGTAASDGNYHSYRLAATLTFASFQQTGPTSFTSPNITMNGTLWDTDNHVWGSTTSGTIAATIGNYVIR